MFKTGEMYSRITQNSAGQGKTICMQNRPTDDYFQQKTGQLQKLISDSLEWVLRHLIYQMKAQISYYLQLKQFSKIPTNKVTKSEIVRLNFQQFSAKQSFFKNLFQRVEN